MLPRYEQVCEEKVVFHGSILITEFSRTGYISIPTGPTQGGNTRALLGIARIAHLRAASSRRTPHTRPFPFLSAARQRGGGSGERGLGVFQAGLASFGETGLEAACACSHLKNGDRFYQRVRGKRGCLVPRI